MRVKLTCLGILTVVFLIMPIVDAVPLNETIQFTLSDGVTPRENNVFVRDSYLRVYIHTPLQYNYNRIVAYDYLFLIIDPNDNPVHIQMLKNRSRSYAKEASVHFTKLIPSEWIDGEYTIKIYIMDRVNPKYTTSKYVTPIDPRMSDGEVSDLDEFFSTTNERILIEKGLLKEREDSLIVEKELKFKIDSSAKPYFIRSITVPQSVPPGSTINVVVSLENTQSKEIEDRIIPLLNGEPIDGVDIKLQAFETKDITFEILNSKPGKNIIEIGSKNASYYIEEIPRQPTLFIYSDLITDKVKILKGEEFNVSVTVFNAGEKGTHPVYLLLNDQIEAVENVTLDYGESEVVSFNLTKASPGIYQARIKDTDLMKIIVIQDKETLNNPDESDNEKKFPVPFISGSAVMLILLWLSRGYLNRS